MRERRFDIFDNDICNTEFRNACKNGNIDIAKWLYQKTQIHLYGCINIHHNSDEAFRYTCKNGHLEIAQWLYSLGKIKIRSMSDYAFIGACIYGHLEVAKWLYSTSISEGHIIDIHAQSNKAFTTGYSDILGWLADIPS